MVVLCTERTHQIPHRMVLSLISHLHTANNRCVCACLNAYFHQPLSRILARPMRARGFSQRVSGVDLLAVRSLGSAQTTENAFAHRQKKKHTHKKPRNRHNRFRRLNRKRKKTEHNRRRWKSARIPCRTTTERQLKLNQQRHYQPADDDDNRVCIVFVVGVVRRKFRAIMFVSMC